MATGKISVIVPTLNEEDRISACLENLRSFQDDGHEVIVVDGGSQDRTIQLAQGRVSQLIQTQAGRASQLHHGANAAGGDFKRQQAYIINLPGTWRPQN